jgi:hypothetical protein
LRSHPRFFTIRDSPFVGLALPGVAALRMRKKRRDCALKDTHAHSAAIIINPDKSNEAARSLISEKKHRARSGLVFVRDLYISDDDSPIHTGCSFR